MKLGIVLHRDDIARFEDLVTARTVTLIRRKGLLCEAESDNYPAVKARLDRSVVMLTSYGMADKVQF